MEAAPSTPARGGLATWALAPLLALVALWVTILSTPGSHCDFGDGVPTYAAILIYAIAAAASIGCLAAALRCLARLRSGASGFPTGQLGLAAVVLFALLLVTGPLPIAPHTSLYWRLCLVCIPATGLLLLILLGAALLRRSREDVGLLLPAYLLGAAVFVYPSVAVVTLALKSGALC